MDPNKLESGAHQFEQMDADAVCSQCGTVNDEGTLLCKSCGNNLRDQRAQRIAHGTGGEYITPKKNPIHMLTGLLVVFGVLAVFYVVFNLQKFENMMIDSISSQENPADQDLWEGTYAEIYEKMITDVDQNQTSENLRRITLNAPPIETAYSGRYLILREGAELNTDNIIGEAQLQQIGERVHFVFLSDRYGYEARGYSDLQIDETTGELLSPMVKNTAELYLNSEYYMASGATVPIPSGGHKCYVNRQDSNRQYAFRAFRVRT